MTADSVVGSNCSAGDRTSVKKSVIGSNYLLRSNVKLKGCVVMNNVHIKDGANLSACLICGEVVVRASCVLKECRIATTTSVDDRTEATGRGFPGQDEDLTTITHGTMLLPVTQQSRHLFPSPEHSPDLDIFSSYSLPACTASTLSFMN